eukprot:CAMPEP_0175931270 /NCGR_PEP_ID=MMETSP0108-20121206/18758_1 /TAXON_ID=195067 ORGANISM="Goniomonas pacifica, Strain CCMP1869" /NCGR_SAMPLE_ID=MMETSP0108 /ASSEMBLY_ACC=CAM_ASM_000204 /LENGTH=116 /DNA_ID=CAMNT_0017254813 /DNA_START=109 /DNA_END=457 /DNA_ORIENTATION=-
MACTTPAATPGPRRFFRHPTARQQPLQRAPVAELQAEDRRSRERVLAEVAQRGGALWCVSAERVVLDASGPGIQFPLDDLKSQDRAFYSDACADVGGQQVGMHDTRSNPGSPTLTW